MERRPRWLGPPDGRSALEWRAVRVLDTVLGEEEANSHDFTHAEGALKEDRSAAQADVFRFGVMRLARDRELARDANRKPIVLPLLRLSLRHIPMMRKMRPGSKLPVLRALMSL